MTDADKKLEDRGKQSGASIGTGQSSSQVNVVESKELVRVAASSNHEPNVESSQQQELSKKHKLKIHPIIAKTIESCRISAATSSHNNNNNTPNKQQTSNIDVQVVGNESKLKKVNQDNNNNNNQAKNESNRISNSENLFKETQHHRIVQLEQDSGSKRSALASLNENLAKIITNQLTTNNSQSNKQQQSSSNKLEPRRSQQELESKANNITQQRATVAKEKIINSELNNDRRRKGLKQIATNQADLLLHSSTEQPSELKGDHYVYACNESLDLGARHKLASTSVRSIVAVNSLQEDEHEGAPRNKHVQQQRALGAAKLLISKSKQQKLLQQQESLPNDNNQSLINFKNPMQAIEAKYFDFETSEQEISEHRREYHALDCPAHANNNSNPIFHPNNQQQLRNNQVVHLQHNEPTATCQCDTNQLVAPKLSLLNSKYCQHHATASSAGVFGGQISKTNLRLRGNQQLQYQLSSASSGSSSVSSANQQAASKIITKISRSRSNQLPQSTTNHDQNWLLIQQQQQHQLEQLLELKQQAAVKETTTMFEQVGHQFGQPGLYYPSGTTTGSSLSGAETNESSPPQGTSRNPIIQHHLLSNQLHHHHHHQQLQAHHQMHQQQQQHCQSTSSIIMNYTNHRTASGLFGRLANCFRCCLPTSCHSKCFTNTLMAVTILIFIVVLSFSLYLTLPMQAASKSQFAALSGRLKITSRGDQFQESLLNRTSQQFILKQVQYETILRGAFDRTHASLRSFPNHLVQCEVYSFRPGSLWVYFRLYINKETLMGDPMLRRRKAHDEALEAHFLPRLTQQTILSGFEQLMATSASNTNGSSSTIVANSAALINNATSNRLVRSQQHKQTNNLTTLDQLHSLKSFDEQIMRLMPIIEAIDMQSVLVSSEFDLLASNTLPAMSDNLRSSGQFQQPSKPATSDPATTTTLEPPLEQQQNARRQPPVSNQKPVGGSTRTTSLKSSAQDVARNVEKDDKTITTFTLANHKQQQHQLKPQTSQKLDLAPAKPTLVLVDKTPTTTPSEPATDLDPFLRNQAAKQHYNVILGAAPTTAATTTTTTHQTESMKPTQPDVVKLSFGQPVTSQHKPDLAANVKPVQQVQTRTNSAGQQTMPTTSSSNNQQKNQKQLATSSSTTTTSTSTSTTTSTTTTRRPPLLDTSASIQELWNNALNSSNRMAIRQNEDNNNKRRPSAAVIVIGDAEITSHLNNDKHASSINDELTIQVADTSNLTTPATSSTSRPHKVSPLQNQGGSMVIANAKLQQAAARANEPSAIILSSDNLQINTSNNQNRTNTRFVNAFKSNKPTSSSINSKPIDVAPKPTANKNTNNNNKIVKVVTVSRPSVSQNSTSPKPPTSTTTQATQNQDNHHQTTINLSRTNRVQQAKPSAKPAPTSSSTASSEPVNNEQVDGDQLISVEQPVQQLKPTRTRQQQQIANDATTNSPTSASTQGAWHQAPHQVNATTTTTTTSSSTTVGSSPTATDQAYVSMMNSGQTTRPGTSIFSSQWKPINMTSSLSNHDQQSSSKLISIGSGESASNLVQVPSLQGSQSPFAMPMPSDSSDDQQRANRQQQQQHRAGSLATTSDLKPIRSHRQNSTQNRKPNNRITNTHNLLPLPQTTTSRTGLVAHSEHHNFESHRVTGIRMIKNNNKPLLPGPEQPIAAAAGGRTVDDFSISPADESLGAVAQEGAAATPAEQPSRASGVTQPRTLDAFSFQTLSLPPNANSTDQARSSFATTPLASFSPAPSIRRLTIDKKLHNKKLRLISPSQAEPASVEERSLGLLDDDSMTTQPSVVVASSTAAHETGNQAVDGLSIASEADLLIDRFENRRGPATTRINPVEHRNVLLTNTNNHELLANNNLEMTNNTILAQCRYHGCRAKDTMEFICLNNNQICDEFIDCQDESDEHDCVSLLKYDNIHPDRLSFSNGAGIIYLNRRGSLAPMCIDYVDEHELMQAARMRGASDFEQRQVRKEASRKQDELIRQINTMGQYACSLQSFSKLISFKVNNHQSVDDMHLIRSSKFYHRLSIVSNLDDKESNNNNRGLESSIDAYKSGSPDLKVLMSTSVECPSQRTVFVKCSSFECGLDSFSVRDNKNPDKVRDGVINDSPWLVKLYHQNTLACHGYLIDEMWLISSSECFASYPESLPTDWTAEISYEHYGNDYYQSIESNRRSIRNVYFHEPKNGASLLDSTIVLAKLERPVRFSPLNRPICLPLGTNNTLDIERSNPYQDCFTAMLPFAHQAAAQLSKQDLILSKVRFNKLGDCLSDSTRTTMNISEANERDLICLTELADRSSLRRRRNVTNELDASRVLICSTKQVSRSGSKWTVVGFQNSRMSRAVAGGFGPQQLFSTIASQMEWIIDTMNPMTSHTTEMSPTVSVLDLHESNMGAGQLGANGLSRAGGGQTLPQTILSTNADFQLLHQSSSFHLNQGSKPRHICNQYKCSSGECLSWAKTCDGSYDCANHDDEKYCHR